MEDGEVRGQRSGEKGSGFSVRNISAVWQRNGLVAEFARIQTATVPKEIGIEVLRLQLPIG
jgi:hypothetical protein